MSEFLFPVHSLNNNISNFLSKVKSAKIYESITSGMQNEVNLIDKNCKLSDIAFIETLGDGTNNVTISSAFCQYFWLLCDITLKILDRRIIQGACVDFHRSILNFKYSVEQTLSIPRSKLSQMFPVNYQIDVNRYLDYLHIVPELLDDDFWDKIGFEMVLADSLSQPDVKLNLDAFKAIDMKSKYSERTNSVYTYGMAFIMLYEMAHYQLNHLQKKEETEDEVQADYKAFLEIYNDIQGEERFSAICGMMSVFFVFMMLNPKLIVLGVHPREEKRLMTIYDEVVKENPKYTLLLVSLLDFWAKICHVDDFPKNLPPTEESVRIIRQYFEAH